MKLFIKFKYLLVVPLVVLYSCETDFDEINTDPNNPVKVSPSSLVSNSMWHIIDNYWGRDFNLEIGSLMVQHIAQNEYTTEQNYRAVQSSFNALWNYMYASTGVEGSGKIKKTGGLIDLVSARKLVENDKTLSEAQKKNQLAIIDIMYVFAFQMITDLWGDVPYSQAFDVKYNYPVYDKQSAIYKDMIDKVGKAVDNIDVGTKGFTSGDLLFSGNMGKWKGFASGLLMRLGIRVSKADKNLAKSAIDKAMVGGLPTEDVKFTFSSIQDVANPIYRDRVAEVRDDFRISKILVDAMKANNDPRLSKFAMPVPGSKDIVGIPYGLSDADATLLKKTTSDLHTDIEFKATAPAFILTLAEIEFYKAEAFLEGLATGDPKVAYEKGIKASLAQWGITTKAEVDKFIAEPGIAYKDITSIAQQKWVALYTNGLEAYSEWRRLGIPVLKPGPDAAKSTIPVRTLWPVTEKQTNEVNYLAAGENKFTTPVWWDK